MVGNNDIIVATPGRLLAHLEDTPGFGKQCLGVKVGQGVPTISVCLICIYICNTCTVCMYVRMGCCIEAQYSGLL
jgi:hypothetical protein